MNAEANDARSRATVLVVDDEPGMRHFLEKALAPRVARVLSAASAEDAEALLLQHRFDLLMLDIALPGKNGIAAAEGHARAGRRRRGRADHRVRRPRHRDRGAARRRRRHAAQAVSHHAGAGRGAPRAGTRAAAGARTGCCGARCSQRTPPADGLVGGSIAIKGLQAALQPRRRGRQHGAADRRVGHRQGARRARAAPPEPARRRPVRAGELRDDRRPSSSRRNCSAAATTARTRRPVRLCAGRHAVPRRDRRAAAGAAGDTAARARRPARATAGQRAGDPGGRAHRRGDATAAARRSRGQRTLPRRPVLPAAGGARSACRRCARTRRTSPSWSRTSSARWRRGSACRPIEVTRRRDGLPAAVRLAGQRARTAQPDRAFADRRRAERVGAVPEPAARRVSRRPPAGAGANRPTCTRWRSATSWRCSNRSAATRRAPRSCSGSRVGRSSGACAEWSNE